MSANIHHSSESVEWYTPEWLVELCRSVLGRIDTDPCSCDFAQQAIKADIWLGENEDGLSQPWNGNVFMNPPGGFADDAVKKKWGSRSNAQCWFRKLQYEIKIKNVSNAIVVCFNLDTLRALQPQSPICILKKRCKFDKLESGKRVAGGSPAHGTGLILLSNSIDMVQKWVEIMSPAGRCYRAS